MSTTLKVLPSPELDQIIKKVIEDRAAYLIEQEIKALSDKVATRLKADLGQLVLSVLSQYSVQEHGTTLHIRVDNQFNPSRGHR